MFNLFPSVREVDLIERGTLPIEFIAVRDDDKADPMVPRLLPSTHKLIPAA